MKLHTTLGLALLLVGFSISAPALAQKKDNPEVERLNQRLSALDNDPAQLTLAALERLQARNAIDAITRARRGEIATALQIAQWRVEIAELALHTGTVQQQLQALEREHSELLLESSRREAARALQEAERLRILAQIQTEEAERLRQAAEAEALARQEAEEVLNTVASDQAARARAAQRRAAELKAKEEALRRQLEDN